MIVESEDMQSTLSSKMVLINHKLTTLPQPTNTVHTPSTLPSSDSHSPSQTSKTTQVSPPTNTVEPARQEPSDSHPASQYITRLPKLEVSKYSGDPLNWQSFWDCFESAIDLNPNLSVVQKLNYLRTQLESKAALA